MLIKVVVSRELYVEANEVDEALQAVKDDYKNSSANMETTSFTGRVVIEGLYYDAEFAVDPKTKKLISL